MYHGVMRRILSCSSFETTFPSAYNWLHRSFLSFYLFDHFFHIFYFLSIILYNNNGLLGPATSSACVISICLVLDLLVSLGGIVSYLLFVSFIQYSYS